MTTDAAPSPSLDCLFDRGNIGKLELQSRVLMAPMEKNIGTGDGLVTQRYIDYLVARARTGVGLLRVEATYVDPVGRGRQYQLGAHSDSVVPALRQMVAAVHAAGGRVSLELAHCGRQTDARVTGRQPVAPSPVPCELTGGFMPRELTIPEIREIVSRFAAAAARIKRAGVDAVEIHGASGYLLNAFTSPNTNLRRDEYGGSLENRMRFPLEVVAAVRDTIGPDLPLIYRICADDYVPGGLTRQESWVIAAALERAGVDLIDVSAGTYESILATQPPMESEPGPLLDLAGTIKKRVSIPVATAGKLAHLDVAAAAVRNGTIDFVTIGRGLHADPDLLIKARSNRLAEVRQCIACGECAAWVGAGGVAYCAVNPATNRERTLAVRPAVKRRRVMVIGGGPAGLEAARAASLRGHDVELYERSGRTGGRVHQGALADGRRDFAEPVRFLDRELDRLGVRVHLNTDVTVDAVASLRPDVAIVATGAQPSLPPVPGSDLAHALSASSFLDAIEAADGALPAGLGTTGTVAVLGGSWVGCHVASLLLERGAHVSIIEIRDSLGYDMNAMPGHVLRSRVSGHPRATVRTGCTVEGIWSEHVEIWNSAAGRNERLPADAVIIVERQRPDHELADAIRERGAASSVFEIGDCAEPRKLADALQEAATLIASWQ